MNTFTILLTVIGICRHFSFVHAWNVTFYSDTKCEGEELQTIEAAPGDISQDSICRIVEPFVYQQPRSIRVRDPEERWSWPYTLVRFYSTSDCSQTCKERHVVAEVEYNGCSSWPAGGMNTTVQSFKAPEIIKSGRFVDMKPLDDSQCEALRHGDELIIHGIHWRMQQVGGRLFRQIAKEDWDDTIHIRETKKRQPQHGDVDAFGEYKFWESYPDKEELTKVKIHEWDESRHYPRTKADILLEQFESQKSRLCRDSKEIPHEFFAKNPQLATLCLNADEESGKEANMSQRVFEL